jgi:hypothetical protein
MPECSAELWPKATHFSDAYIPQMELKIIALCGIIKAKNDINE